MRTKLCVLLLTLAFAAPAFAGPATPGLDRREARMEKRIDKGAASGQLTPKEQSKLERSEDRLERHEERAKADGKVTPQERRRLDREADHNSRAIRRQKHDKQRVTQ